VSLPIASEAYTGDPVTSELLALIHARLLSFGMVLAIWGRRLAHRHSRLGLLRSSLLLGAELTWVFALYHGARAACRLIDTVTVFDAVAWVVQHGSAIPPMMAAAGGGDG
jgi:hypothetical protein